MLFSLKAGLAATALLSNAVVNAATVTYDFDVGWVTANPDGAFERPTMGINGQWPLPAITATVGDRVVVNVNNKLENQTTSLHFHGLYQVRICRALLASFVYYSSCKTCPESVFDHETYVTARRYPREETLNTNFTTEWYHEYGRACWRNAVSDSARWLLYLQLQGLNSSWYCHATDLTKDRLINQVHIGTMLIRAANIPMVCVAR